MSDGVKRPGVTSGSQKRLFDPAFGVELDNPLTDEHLHQLFDRPSFQRTANDGSVENVFCEFYSYIARDAATRLASEGLSLTYGDLKVLNAVLFVVAESPELKVSTNDLDREKEILKTAIKLKSLLESPLEAYRDTYLFDHEKENWEVVDSLYMDDHVHELEILIETARDRVERYGAILDSPNRPRRRSDLIERHFYWLAVIAYWHYYLNKDVACSTSENKNDAYGPMIRFIQILSANRFPDLTGDTIRAWVRRHLDKVATFKEVVFLCSSFFRVR